MSERKIRGIIWKCNLCGFCPKDMQCPGFDEDSRWESSYARGKIAIVHAMIQDKERDFQNSESARESLFSCTGCGHCQYICPSGIDVPSIIYYGRKMLVNANNYPKKNNIIIENISKFGNPFGEEAPRDDNWPDLKKNINAETVYYPGCMAIYRTPEVAYNTIKLFNALGEKIKIFQNETCCSGILYRTGHRNLIEDNVKKMLEEIHDNPPKQIIFTCPGCLTAFKEMYQTLLKEKFKKTKLLHFSEYLIQKLSDLGKEDLNIKQNLENKVKTPIIWHDPCHLARGVEIYEEPRKILNILQIPYIEFEHNKKDTNCCGSGSGVRSSYSELAENTTLQRLKEVKELGAKTILTSCPFCEFQYSNIIQKYKFDFYILDLNSLLIEILE